jgi:hypothetical protein
VFLDGPAGVTGREAAAFQPVVEVLAGVGERLGVALDGGV